MGVNEFHLVMTLLWVLILIPCANASRNSKETLICLFSIDIFWFFHEVI